ncbi:MAG: 50S ribosomal protein L25/general stress protein Ctc [Gammaproteobacteria bacterium]|nr:50S ribosomal protein L25/general stress protein Ctc [Gammaproteobacteria bacterium]
MATQLTLEVSTRESVGSGAVGRLRRIDDAVPGVLYGAGQETVNITLPTRVLLKAMQNENFLSQIIELKLDGHAEQVVVRDMQRHPATENITHIDFLRIREDQEIQVSVPIRFINEESCIGVRMSGGTITRNMVEVEISCLPKDLPEAIVVDMEDIDIGSAVHLSGLALPAGVSIPSLGTGDDSDRNVPVVSVSIVRVQEEDVEEEEAADELALDEEGAEIAEGDEETPDSDEAAEE